MARGPLRRLWYWEAGLDLIWINPGPARIARSGAALSTTLSARQQPDHERVLALRLRCSTFYSRLALCLGA
jgi:hypothetical protein